MDDLELRLEGQSYLFGTVLTAADLRLFATLVRFDTVYATHFRCTKKRLTDYPELWRFTRRSVPRGVALGLFSAFIIPVGQIFLAAFLAWPARANVPLAAAVTFVIMTMIYLSPTLPSPLLAQKANQEGPFPEGLY